MEAILFAPDKFLKHLLHRQATDCKTLCSVFNDYKEIIL